jgi:hypothetical protein
MKKMIVCGVMMMVGVACYAQKDTVKHVVKVDYEKSKEKADLAFSGKDYLTAKRFYKLALQAKPTEIYPKDQIDICDKKMSSDSWISTDLTCPCNGGKSSPKPFTAIDNSNPSNIYNIASKDSIAYSVLPGNVTAVAKDSNNHTYVTVKHGKYLVTYSNLTSVKVKLNDEIKEGDAIGLVKKVGQDYVLEFSMWHGKDKEDAAKFLRCKQY